MQAQAASTAMTLKKAKKKPLTKINGFLGLAGGPEHTSSQTA